MVKQNVLVLGSGAREHALTWKLAQSPKIGQLFVAPGNAGTSEIAQNINIDLANIRSLKEFVKKHDVSLTIVGHENSLAAGIVDRFQKAGLRIFGPVKKAAEIEWSKSFAKKFMQKYSVPTANFQVFNNPNLALTYSKGKVLPIVIKVSGLARGKGVFVCQNLVEVISALALIFEKKLFGESGRKVVVEDYLQGQEISIHALSDGRSSVLFPTSQDHKPIFDGDKGPNTAGMGTYAPVPLVDKQLLDEIEQGIVLPTLAGLDKDGRNFHGCLFPGLMLTQQGPKVLEFNARFGDPETQSYIRLLRTDLLELLNACVDGTLVNTKPVWKKEFAICVVLASKGYPGKHTVGHEIKGIQKAETTPGVVVFHAGTEISNGKLVSSGGRVLSVTAVGKTLSEAREKVYAAVNYISFKNMSFRTDIAAKAL